MTENTPQKALFLPAFNQELHCRSISMLNSHTNLSVSNQAISREGQWRESRLPSVTRAEDPSPKPAIGVPMDYARKLKVETHGTEKLDIVCTSNPAKAEEMLWKLRKNLGGMFERIVGVDVEFTQGLNPEKAAVLQLCVEEMCLVYHITAATERPKILEEFLMEKMYTFVGFCIEGDKQMLKNSGFEVNPGGGYIDLQREFKGPYRCKYRDSLADVAGLVIHPFYKNMKNKINREEDHKLWGISPLPGYLIEYAALEAYATYWSCMKCVVITKGTDKAKEEKERGDDYSFSNYAFYSL